MLPTYKPGDAREYAQSQGWAYKQQGSEILLRQCPWCGKADKLSWNDDTGFYQCFSAACGQKGNYFTLRRDLGDPVVSAEPLTALKQQQRAKKRITFERFAPMEKNLGDKHIEYLASRGISEESARKWKLGAKEETPDKHRVEIKAEDGQSKTYEHNVDWLMIPYITQQGNIADVKYRALPPAPKRFKRLGGGDSILYGEHLLPQNKGKRKGSLDTLYLCEGELDAITLDQHGFSPALSTTTGAASFPPRWYDLIVSSGAKRIVLVYDNDVDGQAAAEKLAKKFTDADREVVNVILEDAKDANEYFLKHTAEDFRELVKQSRPIELEYCLSMGAVLDQLEEQLFASCGQLNGFPSVHQNLNDLIDGGYWNGQLITVIGGSGTGKTSLVQQDLLNIASNYGPAYFMCLEMPPVMVARKIINHLYHVPIPAIKQHHVQQYRADLERRGFFFGAGRFRHIDELCEAFTKAYKRYDLKVIGFDNIHYLCRDEKNQAQQISSVTKGFKDLAVELNVPLIAIAQPGKFDRAERIINENDVKGSSAIEQDSDYMILMWRPTLRTDIEAFGTTMGQKENMSPLTYLRVGKARYSPGGETLLYFHGEVSTFRQLSEKERETLVAEAVAKQETRSARKGQNK
jgi:replicative DNA helicase